MAFSMPRFFTIVVRQNLLDDSAIYLCLHCLVLFLDKFNGFISGFVKILSYFLIDLRQRLLILCMLTISCLLLPFCFCTAAIAHIGQIAAASTLVHLALGLSLHRHLGFELADQSGADGIDGGAEKSEFKQRATIEEH